MSRRGARTPLARRLHSTAYVAINASRQARFPFRRPAAIERAQRRRLKAIVAYAWARVPHYAETMRSLGLTPDQFRTASDLARLPVVERDQLQRDPERFLAQPPPGELLEQRTSGSSGEARSYFREGAAVAQDAAHFSRVMSIVRRNASRGPALRQASILAPVSSAVKAQHAYRAQSLVPERFGVRNIHLSLLDPVGRNVDQLNRFKPDVIYTHGSYAEVLSAHWRDGSDDHRPGAIVYSADHLPPAARRLLTEELGILVLSAYQAVEAPQIAFECECHAGLHANVDIYPVRIVSDELADMAAGEEGDLIVSNLVNRGTVLLNYRLGDRARHLSGECECGRNLPRISLAEGRSEDWLVTERGERLHPQTLSMWLHWVPGVFRFQAVQEVPGRVRVDVVAAPGSDLTKLRSHLERELERRLGAELVASVAFVESPSMTGAGKVPAVISTVDRASAPAR